MSIRPIASMMFDMASNTLVSLHLHELSILFPLSLSREQSSYLRRRKKRRHQITIAAGTGQKSSNTLCSAISNMIAIVVAVEERIARQAKRRTNDITRAAEGNGPPSSFTESGDEQREISYIDWLRQRQTIETVTHRLFSFFSLLRAENRK